MPYRSLGSFRSTFGRLRVVGDGERASQEAFRALDTSSCGTSMSTRIGYKLLGSSSCETLLRQETPSGQTKTMIQRVRFEACLDGVELPDGHTLVESGEEETDVVVRTVLAQKPIVIFHVAFV